jgi:hypothetical protein
VRFLERWDRHNDRVLQRQNERAKSQPLVKPGALAIIFADVTLNVAWMLFLIGAILLIEEGLLTKIVGGAFSGAAVLTLIIGGRHVVEKVREAQRQRRRA